MPRNGSGVYSLPPGTDDFQPETKIESAKIDSLSGDLEADANAARPIVAGGTGAGTVIAAHDNIRSNGNDIASAATVNLDNATGVLLDVTGTVTTTAITLSQGKERIVRCAAAWPITAGASLIVDGATSVTTTYTAGDLLLFLGGASSVVRVWKLGGAPISSGATLVDIRHNLITNPSAQASQENGNAAGTTSGYYPADEWITDFSTSDGAVSSQRVQETTPDGAVNRVRTSVTNADTNLAAGEYLMNEFRIEGSKFAKAMFGTANAVDLVGRFMFNGSAGTRGISLRNAAGDRSYVTEFTVAGAAINTDTIFEFTIPGDTAGTWPTGDVVAGYLRIAMATGSTWQTTADSWQAGHYFGTSSTVTGLSAVQDFDVGDVGLKLDPESIGVYGVYEVPDPAENLRGCQRLYVPDLGASSRHIWSGWATSGSNHHLYVKLPVTMRTTPAISPTYRSEVNFDTADPVVGDSSREGFFVLKTANASGAGYYTFTYAANARMGA